MKKAASRRGAGYCRMLKKMRAGLRVSKSLPLLARLGLPSWATQNSKLPDSPL